MGIILGKSQKYFVQRQIELGNLISYHDVDLVSNDALLQKYLKFLF